ncbi:MAG TPA: hypothetical protein VF790_10370, partial [Dissulfurispiraceae bacterium]
MKCKTKKAVVCMQPQLKGVLNKWVQIIENIAEDQKEGKDVPWWYTEMASLSIFAGAVWKKNKSYFAIEEMGGE